VRSGPGAARTIPLFHTISARPPPLVLGPLNSLVWYVPSLRYTRGLGWRMHCGAEVTESSTNKQHHLSLLVGEVVHVSVLSIFAFALLLLTYVWLHSLSVSLFH